MNGTLQAREVHEDGTSIPVQLVALGNVVRWVRDYGSPRALERDGQQYPMPLLHAARHVLEVLKGSPHVRIYFTRPMDYAHEVTDADVYRKGRKAVEPWTEYKRRPSVGLNDSARVRPIRHSGSNEILELRGRDGLLTKIGEYWTRHLEESWDSLFCMVSPGRVVAIRFDDAWQLFEAFETAPTDQASAGTGQCDSTAQPTSPASQTRVVQPEGGQWPHVKGASWTDAERVAAFLMRHKHKLSVKELEEATGVKRQRLDQVIGKADLLGERWTLTDWRPSAALLAECGVSLAPDPLRSALASAEAVRR